MTDFDRFMKLPIPRIPRPIKKLLRSPLVVISAATLGVRVGKDAYKMNKGELEAKEFRARAGTHFGSITGGMAGAAAGAAAFSVVPGIGTMLGAFAGGLVGETWGGKLGRRAAERLEEYFDDEAVSENKDGKHPSHSTPKRNL